MAAATAGGDWFPLLTALAGYLTSALTEYFRGRGAFKREREAREATRRSQAAERRANFQRETLLDLQEAIMDLVRCCGKAYHLDRKEYAKSGRWGIQLPDELDEAERQAIVKTMLLKVRVRDEQIRELTEKVRDAAIRTGLAKTLEESRHYVDSMTRLLDPLHERIGEILRSLDDQEE